MNAVNLPEALPAAVESEGETDAAFVERMDRETTLVGEGDPPNTMRDADHDRLIHLARRAALAALAADPAPARAEQDGEGRS